MAICTLSASAIHFTDQRRVVPKRQVVRRGACLSTTPVSQASHMRPPGGTAPCRSHCPIGKGCTCCENCAAPIPTRDRIGLPRFITPRTGSSFPTTSQIAISSLSIAFTIQSVVWLRSAKSQHTRKTRSRRRDTQVRYIIAHLQNSSELGRQPKGKQQSAGSGSRRDLRPCRRRQIILRMKIWCTKHAPAVGIEASAFYHQILRIRCTPRCPGWPPGGLAATA
jgi:hypothetical protein